MSGYCVRHMSYQNGLEGCRGCADDAAAIGGERVAGDLAAMRERAEKAEMRVAALESAVSDPAALGPIVGNPKGERAFVRWLLSQPVHAQERLLLASSMGKHLSACAEKAKADVAELLGEYWQLFNSIATVLGIPNAQTIGAKGLVRAARVHREQALGFAEKFDAEKAAHEAAKAKLAAVELENLRLIAGRECSSCGHHVTMLQGDDVHPWEAEIARLDAAVREEADDYVTAAFVQMAQGDTHGAVQSKDRALRLLAILKTEDTGENGCGYCGSTDEGRVDQCERCWAARVLLETDPSKAGQAGVHPDGAPTKSNVTPWESPLGTMKV